MYNKDRKNWGKKIETQGTYRNNMKKTKKNVLRYKRSE